MAASETIDIRSLSHVVEASGVKSTITSERLGELMKRVRSVGKEDELLGATKALEQQLGSAKTTEERQAVINTLSRLLEKYKV